ncbi:MAG: hypothetical protein FWF05_06895 [Oscillospiraceae bacterium]|nr:hypothetical protein [Oscillospiraceae bacterium]
MRKSVLKRAMSILLAGVMAVSVFMVTAGALSQGPYIDEDNAINITGNFTAEIKAGRYSYYRFVPEKSGWYEIYSLGNYNPKIGVYKYTYGHSYENLAGSNYSADGNFDVLYYFQAGETYYFPMCVIPDTDATFDVKIDEYLGNVEAEIVSYPSYSHPYILDYDCGSRDDGDFLYFNDGGLEVKLTFDNGNVLVIEEYRYQYLLELCYDKPFVGINELRFNAGDETIFTLDIEVIAHPIESIEIVKPPNKTSFRYRLDGYMLSEGFYPLLNVEGMEVKINYTDGTSEIVKADENEIAVYKSCFSFNEYHIDISPKFCCTVGKHDAYASCLGREATFEITVVKPTVIQIFLLFMSDTAKVFYENSSNHRSFTFWYNVHTRFYNLAVKFG